MCPREELEESASDLKKLASVLQQVDAASMHILRCYGTAYQRMEHRRHLLFYELPSEPKGTTNWTLEQALSHEHTLKPSLNVRVQYAIEISMAVMFTHAAGLVHKSISPQNILSEHESPAWCNELTRDY